MFRNRLHSTLERLKVGGQDEHMKLFKNFKLYNNCFYEIVLEFAQREMLQCKEGEWNLNRLYNFVLFLTHNTYCSYNLGNFEKFISIMHFVIAWNLKNTREKMKISFIVMVSTEASWWDI